MVLHHAARAVVAATVMGAPAELCLGRRGAWVVGAQVGQWYAGTLRGTNMGGGCVVAMCMQVT